MKTKTLGLGLCLLPLFCGSALATPEPARKADDFVERIGVVTHLTYNGISYVNNWTTPFSGGATIPSLLGDLGVRHIRDGSNRYAGDNPPVWERFYELYGSYGIKTTAVFSPASYWDINTQVNGRKSMMELLKLHPEMVAGVEGPNETDLWSSSFSYGGQTGWPAVKSFQNALYNAVKADSVTTSMPVIAPAMANSSGSSQELNLAPLSSLDLESMHSYAGGGIPSSGLDNKYIPWANNIVGSGNSTKPIVATESGYHTAPNKTDSGQPGISEAAHAKYIPRLFGEYFNRDIRRAVIYELMDEGNDLSSSENNYGLVRYDGSPKPAYTATKNLISLLKEGSWNAGSKTWTNPATAYTPNFLDYTLSGNTSNVRHTLLQKSNGEYYLLLWQDVSSYNTSTKTDISNPDAAVTLNLPSSIASVATNLPNDDTNWTSKTISGGAVSLNVPDKIMVVRLTPSPGSSGIGDGTGLKGEYYSGNNFNTLVKTQTDPTVNFNWGAGSPQNLDGSTMSSVGPNNFSVRWTGQVQAIESGIYTFTTTTDDGARLWINGTQLVDKWQSQSGLAWSGTITLTAGLKYNVKFEYYEGTGNASAKLNWTRPGQSSQVIPQSQLFPVIVLPVAPTVPNGTFETPATSTYIYRPTGGNWTFVAESGVQKNGSAWNAATAPDGVQTAFLQKAGNFAQAVNFTTPGNFTLTFQGAQRSGNATPQSLQISVGGTIIETWTPPGNTFTSHTTPIFNVPIAGNVTIEFKGTSVGVDRTAFVDSVAVNLG